ncbi:MAG: AI-2E family transporter [Flavobacterium sp.]
MEPVKNDLSNIRFTKVIDFILRLGILSLLLLWCVDMLKPFLLILIWASVITIAIYPLHISLTKLFRGRKMISIIFLTSILLSIILVPSSLIAYSLYDGINYIREIYSSGQPLIPPPGGNTASWPVFAKPILDFWQLASDNLQGVFLKYSNEVKQVGIFALSGLAGIGSGVALFSISIITSALLLAYSNSLISVSGKIFTKLAGNKGDEFAEITVLTIRNVIKGILGVAVIQAAMVGIGFFAAGVPFAGLWTILCLILAIIQLGIGPVAIPVVIYMFSVTDATTSIILAIWIGITLVIDNILKPILLGRNAPAPMLVIFLGAIGGFMHNGFIGLFLGAVVLTLAYKLFLIWLDSDSKNKKIEDLLEEQLED